MSASARRTTLVTLTAIALALLEGRTVAHAEQAPPTGGDTPLDPAKATTLHQAAPPATPAMSPEAAPITVDLSMFGPDPDYGEKPYDAAGQIQIYGGKSAVKTPRPLLEIGRALYGAGPIGKGYPIFGDKNRFFPQAMLFGDWRTVVAANDLGKEQVALAATQLNIDLDIKLTGTERIHAFWKPLDRGAKNTRVEFDRTGAGKKPKSTSVFNVDPVTVFFEGDLGAITSNFTDTYASFDAPVAFGRMPLLFQNGVWLEDAMIGVAATPLAARHIGRLDVANLDVTVFAGFDEVTTPALRDASGAVADHAGKVYGVTGFFETRRGYLETGFARIEDTRTGPTDFSYNNMTVAFTKRYMGWLSNSVRVIANFGQEPGAGKRQTADGWIVLVENSLVSKKPSTVIPYANFWFGSDRPQSVARAGAAGGILRNTGLAFETDGITGFPKLDDTGADTYGGAIGIEHLFNLDRQLVLEVAGLGVHGNATGRPAKGPQAAVSARFQQPLTERWILRADATLGVRDKESDVSGVRVELRCKF